jgi:hypothetical protein
MTRTVVNVDYGDEEAAQVKREKIVERIAKQAWRQKTKRKKWTRKLQKSSAKNGETETTKFKEKASREGHGAHWWNDEVRLCVRSTASAGGSQTESERSSAGKGNKNDKSWNERRKEGQQWWIGSAAEVIAKLDVEHHTVQIDLDSMDHSIEGTLQRRWKPNLRGHLIHKELLFGERWASQLCSSGFQCATRSYTTRRARGGS